MSEKTFNNSYSYTNLENHFATEADKQLLPLVIHGDSQEITNFIKNNIKIGSDLKTSLALVAYLYERGEGEYLSRDVIKSLLTAGVDPNNRMYSRIAIHKLYSLGVLNEFIDLFIDFGANLNVINDNGVTVLGQAMSNSDIDTMKMLIAKGASVLIQNNYGDTVLSSLNRKIHDSTDDDERYTPTCIEEKMIELLDRCARKEMQNLGLLTEKQASIQNWRCNYFNNEDLPF